MANLLDEVLDRRRPALLIGNGINRHDGPRNSSWEELLAELIRKHGVTFDNKSSLEMSNTELFDILDLACPEKDKGDLQGQFSGLMSNWEPVDHHKKIVGWAQRHQSPIITVNFDENLSKAIDARFFKRGERFTHYYPWSSYFSNQEITTPRTSFAIWHAHGMVRYKTSIRLGLTHYMGSVQRARRLIYSRHGLRASATNNLTNWSGSDTWLEVFFFCPLLVLGFGFGKDENFLRWLFLERARLHKLRPELAAKTWFVDTSAVDEKHRLPFLKGLGMEVIKIPDYAKLYESSAWQR